VIVVSGLSPDLAYLRLLRLATNKFHDVSPSRVGDMFDLGCVCVELTSGERLNALPGRAVNPAFAVMEAAWVIAGSNELPPLQRLISNYSKYSDDGETLSGAYGYRLRHFFGVDQLAIAASELKKSTYTRRVVLSIFDAGDLQKSSNDIPCNTQLILRNIDGLLDMTVINRSNDVWLGVPYNWFVFRVIQLKIADDAGLNMGVQRHFSSCMHLYCRDFDAASRLLEQSCEDRVRSQEASVVGVDLREIIDDAENIIAGHWNELRSDRLREFFSLYEDARDERTRPVVAKKCDDQDVLQLTLAHWIAARVNHRDDTMDTTTSTNTSSLDEPIQLVLQRCVFSQPTEVIASIIKRVANRLVPVLPQMLSVGLPAGATVQVEQSAAQSLSVQVALEILMGTLDAELHKTPMGERFVQKLQDVATELGLTSFVQRGRECSSGQLRDLFGDLATITSQ
jgi:hypothetical protein